MTNALYEVYIFSDAIYSSESKTVGLGRTTEQYTLLCRWSRGKLECSVGTADRVCIPGRPVDSRKLLPNVDQNGGIGVGSNVSEKALD